MTQQLPMVDIDSPCSDMEIWAWESLSNLPTITQPVSGTEVM